MQRKSKNIKYFLGLCSYLFDSHLMKVGKMNLYAWMLGKWMIDRLIAYLLSKLDNDNLSAYLLYKNLHTKLSSYLLYKKQYTELLALFLFKPFIISLYRF